MDSSLSFDFTGTAWARAVGELSDDNEKDNDTVIRDFKVAFVSGIKDMNRHSIVAYPNPTSEKLIIDLTYNVFQKVTIFTTSGQKVYEKEFKPTERKIELDLKSDLGLKGGVYYLRLQNSYTSHLIKLILY